MEDRLSISSNKAVGNWHRLITEWLFDDVAFAVIPILTLAVINKLLGDNFKDFLLIKEWSFATIVFFGVSIRKIIRLKVSIQEIPRSYTLYSGVQAYVIMLIAAVLVMSFVTLSEKGVIARHEDRFLGISQIFLFAIGLYSILLAVIAEQQARTRQNMLPNGIPKRWLLRRIVSSVDVATNSLNYAGYAIERASTITFADQDGQVMYRREEETILLGLQSSIERIERLVAEIKRQLNSLVPACTDMSDRTGSVRKHTS